MQEQQSTPLCEVLELGHDHAVAGINGTIKKVWDFREGKTSKGTDYTVQNIVIEDNGTEMEASLWNFFVVPKTCEGRKISLTAYDGKNGLVGIWVEEKEYKGVFKKKLKIGKGARLDIEGVSMKEHKNAALVEAEVQAVDLTKANLMRLANLYLSSAHVVDSYLRGASFEMFQSGLNPEQIDRITTNLFREAARLNWHDRMPASPLTAQKPQPVALPDEDQPVAKKPVASDDLEGDDIPF